MKKKIFLDEIKGLTIAELKVKAGSIGEELMKLRFRQASGQFEQSHRFRELKRNLARVQTTISQKRASDTQAKAA